MDGFTCKCRAGFKDISSKVNERPGRLCQACKHQYKKKFLLKKFF
jgi:hypothetical protein